MQVGVPAETKADEYRVAITPAGVRELVDAGHAVLVQRGAGLGSGIPDRDFQEQGATLAGDVQTVFRDAELILKVKEPQPAEVALLEPHHVLFAYLHLAPNPELTRALVDSGATCIAYETVEDRAGRLPLLAPMSEVAGRIAVQAGASLLEKPRGGPGKLLGGVPGVAPCRVLVIGGGVVGLSAALMGMGMGAHVCVFDRDIERLRQLALLYETRMETSYGSQFNVERRLPEADLVIGAVLVSGARAPHVIVRSQLGSMKPGSVLVDVAIDQGGCFETSHPTTHSDPTYQVDGITHYCVANMPGAVPKTSTYALTNATIPHVLRLADGVVAALEDDPGLMKGLNVAGRQVTCEPVAEALGLPYVAAGEVMATLPARP